MADPSNDPNDFRPRSSGNAGQAPKVYAFIKPDLEVAIDERQSRDTELEKVCTCDKVCTCNTVTTAQLACRCDTVSQCTCEAVQKCTCDAVLVCSCDTVRTCRCNPQCSCDSHSPGGGGSRVCRCVPVRAH